MMTSSSENKKSGFFSFFGLGKKKDKTSSSSSATSKNGGSGGDRSGHDGAGGGANGHARRRESSFYDATVPYSKACFAHMTEVPVRDVAALCERFKVILAACDDAKVRQTSIKQIKILSVKIAEGTRLVAKDYESGFHPSFQIRGLLEQITAEEASLRARHCLALHRFCCEMEQEVEDELFCNTGFLSTLQGEQFNNNNNNNGNGPALQSLASMNPNLNPTNNNNNNNNNNDDDDADGDDMADFRREEGSLLVPEEGLPQIPPCPNLDLARIYERLMASGGGADGDTSDVAAAEYVPQPEEVQEIFARAAAVFREEPNVVSIELPAVLVGDIHGQWGDLRRHVLPAGGPLVPEAALAAAKEGGKPKPAANGLTASSASGAAAPVTYLFLGDYVDRGSSSLRCLLLLLVAKLLSPSTVFLLRGNHECALTNRHYGFLEECHRMYPLANGKVTVRSPTAEAARGPSAAGSNGGKLPRPGSAPSGGAAPATASGSSSSNGGSSSGGTAAAEEVLVDDVLCDAANLDWGLGDHPLFLKANALFDCLPLCAALYETRRHLSSRDGVSTHAEEEVVRVCAMHGGLSPYIENSLDGVLAINRFKDIESGALADLTWSDPIVNYASPRGGLQGGQRLPQVAEGSAAAKRRNNQAQFVGKVDYGSVPLYEGPAIGFTFSARGNGHNFGEDVTCGFLAMNRAGLLVRAHQCVHEGYQWAHQNRLLTVFSASNYCGMGNRGAVLKLSAKGIPELVQYMNTEGDGVGEASPVPPREFM